MRIKNFKKGFTLLETLVAISILLIAVVGPMSIIGRSLPQSAYARDHAIAVNLAQEGIEAIRQKRDSNMLRDWNGTTTAWDSELGVGHYFVNPMSAAILSFCGGSCSLDSQKIRQNSSGWYYQSSTGGAGLETKFQRIIQIQSSSAVHEKKITVIVLWVDSMGKIYTLPVTEYISGINS